MLVGTSLASSARLLAVTTICSIWFEFDADCGVGGGAEGGCSSATAGAARRAASSTAELTMPRFCFHTSIIPPLLLLRRPAERGVRPHHVPASDLHAACQS